MGFLSVADSSYIYSWGDIEMKNWTILLILSAALTTTALAQRGGGHGNAGGAMGSSTMGAGRMGGNDMGATMSRDARENGSPGAYGSPSRSMASQPPETALTKSPRLSSNLGKLLPSGMTAQEACSGFKNLGQCVAAIHVSHNLGIPFSDLKAKMTGTGSESLGKAIQTLKPTANSKAEAKKGKKQANQDLTDDNS